MLQLRPGTAKLLNKYNEYSALISFGIDWFDLLAVQGTLKSLLQYHRNIHTSSGISTQIYLSLHSPKPPGGSS